MSALDKLWALGRVLRAGESLKDPAKWKNVQNTMNALGIILLAVPQFVDLEITDAQVNAISYGIATLLGVLNPYFTTATTDKIGVPPKS